ALQIELALRTPHNRQRASVFPGEVLMLQTEACKGQTLLLCQRDAPLKATLLVRPSRDLHLYGPLGWRIGTSERRSTSGQCWSLDINDLDVDGRPGSRGKLQHSKVCLHALALQSAISPLA